MDCTTSGSEIYIQVLQECLLLKGCPGQPAELELIAVHKKIIHSEGWIPGIQTLRIRVTGATPLKRHHRRRKMNVMSDIIKSNATHAVMCGAC